MHPVPLFNALMLYSSIRGFFEEEIKKVTNMNQKFEKSKFRFVDYTRLMQAIIMTCRHERIKTKRKLKNSGIRLGIEPNTF